MAKYGFRAGNMAVKKLLVKSKMPVEVIIPKTVAYATGAIVAGWNTRTGTAAKTNANFLVQMPYPMQVVVCPNVAGTAAAGDKLRIIGYKADGTLISEDVVVKGTAASVSFSNNAFTKITSIKPYPSIPAPKSTSVGVGYRPLVVGLPYPLAAAGDLMSVEYDGGYATTAPTVSLQTAYNTLTLSTTAANKTIRVAYLSEMQR